MRRDRPKGSSTPILADKHYDAVSAFTPENLLREARRQKQTAASRAGLAYLIRTATWSGS